ncbi:hypothetical protein D1AOALGA4SA_8126 [Olavius algarvensis Delta 1 endosymbiont]|nr:hypothetical protein D1AOALGA4SA_8126 [Olavius algarvensis Delta 1 endosymbiont]
MDTTIYVKLLQIEGFRNLGIGGLKDKINKLKEIVRQKKLTTGRIP